MLRCVCARARSSPNNCRDAYVLNRLTSRPSAAEKIGEKKTGPNNRPAAQQKQQTMGTVNVRQHSVNEHMPITGHFIAVYSNTIRLHPLQRSRSARTPIPSQRNWTTPIVLSIQLYDLFSRSARTKVCRLCHAPARASQTAYTTHVQRSRRPARLHCHWK